MKYRQIEIAPRRGDKRAGRRALIRNVLSVARNELPSEELAFLGRQLVGRLVLPGDERYEVSRQLFNPRFDPHPSAIIHCMVDADVRLCLEALRRSNTSFRIRAGGSSLAGYSSSAGVIIDVSGLDDVVVDDANQACTVGPGCSLAKLHAILDERRAHLPLGDARSVCVAGFMQGGGFGLTSRTHGMNCDHVIEVRVMLADGRIVRASDKKNHDLWWAVRGGTGGNFGVLLSTRYRLLPVVERHRWSLGWRLSKKADLELAISALMTFQQLFLGADARPEMNVSATVLYLARKPGGPLVTPWLVIWGTYIGREAQMQRALDPLLRNPGCWPRFEPFDMDRPMRKFDRCSRLVSHPLAIDEWRVLLLHFLTGAPNRQAVVQVDAWGGAISKYPRERSAFVHRDTLCNIALTTYWERASEESAAKAFLSSWGELVRPFWNGYIYQNFPEHDVPNYAQNYWGGAAPALAAVKHKYDPTDLFRFPQSIKPSAHGGVEWPPRVKAALSAPIGSEEKPF
jgi:FAD/FMN-containing dehydrogenase